MKSLLCSAALLVVISLPAHAGGTLPKLLKTYAALFDKYDPETLFLSDEVKFDHEHFQNTYMSFFRSLQRHPQKIAQVRWYKITPLMRGIFAHIRYNDDLIPLLIELPINTLFRELLYAFFKLNHQAMKQFEIYFPTPKMKELESLTSYLRLENDVMMSGNLILFMCFLYRDTEHPRAIATFQNVTEELLRSPNLRVRLLMLKHAVLNNSVFEKLHTLVNDTSSPYYHIGARFNLVGPTINTIEQEISSSSSELSGASFKESEMGWQTEETETDGT